MFNEIFNNSVQKTKISKTEVPFHGCANLIVLPKILENQTIVPKKGFPWQTKLRELESISRISNNKYSNSDLEETSLNIR